jgi:hypothetical protein
MSELEIVENLIVNEYFSPKKSFCLDEKGNDISIQPMADNNSIVELNRANETGKYFNESSM